MNPGVCCQHASSAQGHSLLLALFDLADDRAKLLNLPFISLLIEREYQRKTERNAQGRN